MEVWNIIVYMFVARSVFRRYLGKRVKSKMHAASIYNVIIRKNSCWKIILKFWAKTLNAFINIELEKLFSRSKRRVTNANHFQFWKRFKWCDKRIKMLHTTRAVFFVHKADHHLRKKTRELKEKSDQIKLSRKNITKGETKNP